MAIGKVTAIADFEHQKLLVEEYNFKKKFDEFLKLSEFYHVERCENEDCPNCWFVVNLRYLYVQNTVHEMDQVLLCKNIVKWKLRTSIVSELLKKH